MFVDDYLNVLAVSFSMKEITDRNRIPREHLAYGVNSMGASICVLIPFTSWSAFAIGTMTEQGLGFSDYVKAIPYMFFPIIAIIVCLLVALGVIPKVGLIKKAYERVDAGGPLLVEEESGGLPTMNMEGNNEGVQPSSPLNFMIPIVVLIAVMLLCNGSLVHGIIAAILSQLVLYTAQKIMTLSEFTNTLLEGVTGMASLAFVICFAYIVGVANDAMGFSNFVINGFNGAIPPSLLPAIAFLVVAGVSFAAASFWILIVISVPIFIPLAINMGIEPSIVVAAIMSGVAFGSKFCFYSDAVFMTSAGTGVPNITQIKAVAPYVLGSAVLAAIAFVIVGVIRV